MCLSTTDKANDDSEEAIRQLSLTVAGPTISDSTSSCCVTLIPSVCRWLTMFLVAWVKCALLNCVGSEVHYKILIVLCFMKNFYGDCHYSGRWWFLSCCMSH